MGHHVFSQPYLRLLICLASSLWIGLALSAQGLEANAQTSVEQEFSIADTGQDPAIELEPVEVKAERLLANRLNRPTSLSIIERQELEASGAGNLAQALERSLGLSISDYGSSGAQKTLSLRGSTASQVLVLVDGVRLNDELSGIANLACIDIENVERIEILRSGSSALRGSDAVGGVINVITKKDGKYLRVRAENSGYMPQEGLVGQGLYTTKRAANALDLLDAQGIFVQAALKAGPLGIRATARASRESGAFSYLDAGGQTRLRENAAGLAAGASLGTSLVKENSRFDADAFFSYADVGVPGGEGSATNQAKQKESDIRVQANWEDNYFLCPYLDLRIGSSARFRNIIYKENLASAAESSHELTSASLSIDQKASPSSALTILYGLSASASRSGGNSIGQRDRLVAAAFLSPSLELGKLRLAPSLRYDYYSDFFDRYPFSALAYGIGLSLDMGGKDMLKANLGRSYRVPSLEDLYWPTSFGAQGNPALKPETAYQLDLGYERVDLHFDYGAFAYLRYVEDVILWQPFPDGLWRPSNYGRALYPGLEQEVKAEFRQDLRGSLSYAFQPSIILDDGFAFLDAKRVPMIPLHSLKASLYYEKKGSSAFFQARYESLRYLKTANVAYLPSSFVLDAYLKRRLASLLTAYLKADNLFSENRRSLPDYPLPGLKLSLGVILEL